MLLIWLRLLLLLGSLYLRFCFIDILFSLLFPLAQGDLGESSSVSWFVFFPGLAPPPPWLTYLFSLCLTQTWAVLFKLLLSEFFLNILPRNHHPTGNLRARQHLPFCGRRTGGREGGSSSRGTSSVCEDPHCPLQTPFQRLTFPGRALVGLPAGPAPWRMAHQGLTVASPPLGSQDHLSISSKLRRSGGVLWTVSPQVFLGSRCGQQVKNHFSNVSALWSDFLHLRP